MERGHSIDWWWDGVAWTSSGGCGEGVDWASSGRCREGVDWASSGRWREGIVWTGVGGGREGIAWTGVGGGREVFQYKWTLGHLATIPTAFHLPDYLRSLSTLNTQLNMLISNKLILLCWRIYAAIPKHPISVVRVLFLCLKLMTCINWANICHDLDSLTILDPSAHHEVQSRGGNVEIFKWYLGDNAGDGEGRVRAHRPHHIQVLHRTARDGTRWEGVCAALSDLSPVEWWVYPHYYADVSSQGLKARPLMVIDGAAASATPCHAWLASMASTILEISHGFKPLFICWRSLGAGEQCGGGTRSGAIPRGVAALLAEKPPWKTPSLCQVTHEAHRLTQY